MYEAILYNIENKIATITLNRPEVGNAFSKVAYGEIKQALDFASEDENVRVVIITGSGKHFSAGGDIKRFKMLIETKEFIRAENVKAAGIMSFAAKECKKPVIAMINGAAAGAGCALALACDFRFVTPKSKLVMSFVKMGLSGDTGALYYLKNLVGVGKASELMMTGKPVGGEEAVALGLATRLTELEKLQEDTYAFAAELAEMPTFALSKQKELIRRIFYSDMKEYTEIEADFMVKCSYTEDFKEAVFSFLEKRSPNFAGK